MRKRLILVVVMVAVGLLTASRFVSEGDGIEVAATPPSSPMPEKTTAPSVGGSTSSTSAAPVSATTRPAQPVFLYASRTRKGEVAVFQQPVGGGTPEELFRYEDGRDAGEDPRYGVDADLALSPDGRHVAYGVRSALFVRDLADGSVRTVVSSERQPPSAERPEGTPPRWSIPEMNDRVFGVRSPVWSPDGGSLAFGQSGDEWGTFGIVDLESGRYHSSVGASDLAWLPSGDRVVVAGDGYADPGRVHVSRPGDLSAFVDVTDRVPTPPVRDYTEATASPSGRLLAVRYRGGEHPDGPRSGLAILGADGSGFRPLALAGEPLVMAFTADESAMLVVERRGDRSVPVRHPLDGDAPTELRTLPADLPGWPQMEVTASGDLAIVGTNSPEPGAAAIDPDTGGPRGYLSRFLLLDARTGATRYESGDFDRFTVLRARVALRPYTPPPTPPTVAASTTTTIQPCIPHERFGPYVFDLEFSDERRGWAAGTDAIMVTTDGGQTWAPACLPLFGSDAYVRVLARHGDRGWALSGDGVLRTSDGGRHWTVMKRPLADSTPVDMTFVDAERGWLVATLVGGDRRPAGSAILRTDDAGTRWRRMEHWPSEVIPTVRRVTFVDHDHGWVLGTTATGPAVAATSNGGASWQVHHLPASFDSAIEFAFVDERRGWILAMDAPAGQDPANFQYANVLLATTDGGATFSEQARIAQVWDLDFTDTAHGYAIGAQGGSDVLYVTADGGLTWNSSPVPGSAMTAVDFTDSEHGWIGGQNGSCVYRTADGGRTWQGTSADPHARC